MGTLDVVHAQDHVITDLDDVRVIWRAIRHAERARAEAEALTRRASFLADASAALSTTLDPRAILTIAARLAAPTLARGAAAFLADDDGGLSLVEATDATSANTARALASAPHLVAPAAVTGHRQCVLVPLRARDRQLGLLVLIPGHGRRRHDPVDVALVEAFASRVAVAVDHACLFEASQHAIRTRDRVLGIVSHDLRNPISAIGMCATALRSSAQMPLDERQRLASTIQAAVGWTQRLLGDLMDVASIEAGRLAMDAHPIDPIVLLGKSLELFSAEPCGVTVRLAAEVPESLPSIMGDEQRILQVLGNLISNSRKFTQTGGSITLGAGVTSGAIRFVVSDTGPGIAPEHRPHVFDWFWRASRESGEPGTGLGLAIAKGIVEAHGGRIALEHTAGRGATFSFTIPLARPRSGVATRRPEPAAVAASA